MTEKSSGPQWRRIVTESVVIVTSILLAFGIEAWWNDRGDRVEGQEILAGLQQDFEQSRAAAIAVISYHEDNLMRYAAVVNLSAAEISGLPQDSIDRALGAGPYTFDPVRGTLDALIGAGALSLIEDLRLRESLITFLNLADDSLEEVRALHNAAEEVWASEVRLGGPWWPEPLAHLPREETVLRESMSAQTLARVLQDQAFRGQMRRFYGLVNEYLGEVRAMLSQIESIESLLAEALDS